MNVPLSLLLVDDEGTPRRILRDALKAGADLRIDDADGLAQARERMQEHAYDLVLVDYFHQVGRKPQEPIGPSIVRQLQREHEDALFVVYSQEFARHGEEITRKSLEAGAVDAVARDVIYDWQRATVQKYLTDRFATRYRHIEIRPASDLRTQALVDELGEDAIKQLVDKAFQGRGKFSVASLGGGYSGDKVLSLRQLVGGGRVVAKLSRMSTGLTEELRGAPELGDDATLAALPLFREPEKLIQGWWVGFAPLYSGQSLRRELRRRKETGRERLLKKVWRDYLSGRVSNGSSDPSVSTTSVKLRMRPAFRASTVEALEWLEVTQQAGSRLIRPTTLPDLIEILKDDDQLASMLVIPRERFVRSHGDFHADNILTSGGQIRIIDWAKGGTLPRCFDVACLDVDLIVRGAGEDIVNLWRPDLAKSVVNQTLSSWPFTDRLESATRRALIGALPSAGVGKGEYMTAMFFHSCRYLRFSDIPLPRRLVAAAIAWECAKGLVHPLAKSGKASKSTSNGGTSAKKRLRRARPRARRA